MKFAHLADCHIGSWRDPKLKDITTRVFCNAMDLCVKERVDFIVISGDLFNNALPSIDLLKTIVKKMKEVVEKAIPIYGIAGSHDFSPSGRTMLDVLEEAGLYHNVARGEEHNGLLRLKFTLDPRTGAKLAGMIGKKGGLEKEYYPLLERDFIEKEQGYKIFLFHTALSELKPEHLSEMDSNPISLLPKNFNYYAGGHVHIVKHANIEGYSNVVYPGPLFPNSFSELEKLDCGGFYLVTVEGGFEQVKYVPVQVHPIVNMLADSEYWTPQQVTADLIRQASRRFDNAVVTIRCKGVLREGGVADIDFKKVFDLCYHNGAHFVMKNTGHLEQKRFEQVKIASENVDDIESAVIDEHSGQCRDFPPEVQMHLAKSLLHAMSMEKDEAERIIDFEEKLIQEVDRVVIPSEEKKRIGQTAEQKDNAVTVQGAS